MERIVDKLVQIGFVAMFLAIIVTGVVLSYPKYDRARELEKRRTELQQRIEEKNREIAQLRENQRRFTKDKEFVESLARENRRVYPGEIVFIFDK